jgi:acetyl esterase/lipase
MKLINALPVLVVAIAAHASEPATRIVLDVAYLAPGRSEKLDVYLPAPPAAGARSPAVVWIHGGGWTGGEKGEERAKEICGTLAGAGYVAVSINYKLGNDAWPQNLFDCKDAVRFLRVHAGEYRVDPDRIAVAGGSAGGHLALMVGFTAGQKEFEPAAPGVAVSDAVRCIIDLYGPTDLLTHGQTDEKGEPTPIRKLMVKSLAAFGVTSDEAELLRAASPVEHVAKHVPPVLILHGRADTTVDFSQSEKLERLLRERGVEHEFIPIDGIGHTFNWETWNKQPLPHDLRPTALAFLARYLSPAQ